MSKKSNLLELYPEIADQWHPTKNSELLPEQFTYRSGVKIWWKCPKGLDHEWQATIASRTGQNSSCPCCRGSQLSITNSLAAFNGNKNTARSINTRNPQPSPPFLSTLPPQARQDSWSLKRPSVMSLCWQSKHKPFKPTHT